MLRAASLLAVRHIVRGPTVLLNLLTLDTLCNDDLGKIADHTGGTETCPYRVVTGVERIEATRHQVKGKYK